MINEPPPPAPPSTPAAKLRQQTPDAASRLGTDPVGLLLLRFSIPSIGGMLLNALYNVVDRIFVGRGVDEIALGGISLVMPLMTLSMAFAMLFGIGAANMISMRMGQGKRNDAENALNHCFFLLIAVGLLTSVLELALLDPLLALLGAQDGSAAIEYARRYYRIILLGQVFFQLSFGLSHCSRAQGFPVMSLLSMVFGAGLNSVLDPIFIFGFGWGVEGAAIATVISQFCAASWILSFSFSRKALIRIRPKTLKPSLGIVKSIAAFGSASALLQFAMSAVQLLINSSMGWYGEAALGVANGGDIALSGMTIINSFTMFILMPVFGINQGAQPVLGFNYGAKKFDRVRRAYFLAVIAATCICTAGFIVTRFFPLFIIRLFVPDGSPALVSVSSFALRTALLVLPLNGFQIVSSNMFAVTGRPKISILLAMLRQIILLVPCILIFGRLWGLNGVITAMPVADAISVCITAVMIFLEFRSPPAGLKSAPR
ncbi:MAG: MATE family efflux transporter [Spirochaetaceae bacterium]|jgi:putative MATE family efflux protein|nr:MATE family efflux transporter [Spirochaetaceae bacterium]